MDFCGLKPLSLWCFVTAVLVKQYTGTELSSQRRGAGDQQGPGRGLGGTSKDQPSEGVKLQPHGGMKVKGGTETNPVNLGE